MINASRPGEAGSAPAGGSDGQGEGAGDRPDAGALPLATLAHELRTPLAAIIGFAEMMTSGQLGPLGHPRYAEYARDIRAAAAHAVSLLDGLAGASRPNSRLQAPSPESIDINAEAGACLSMMLVLAGQAGLTLTATPASALPPVRADRRHVRQILLNLLSNAVKFTAHGGSVTLSTREADGSVIVEIRDTGCPVPSDHTPAVPSVSTVPDLGGSSGIGLPLSRALAQAHGGRLEVESLPGAGTTARLTFPAAATAMITS